MKPNDTVRVHLDLPRSALVQYAAPAEWMSQLTCEADPGVSRRCYLADVHSAAYPFEVLRRGKLRLTRRADYIEFLRRRSQASKSAEAGSDGADGVLREVGLRVVGGHR
jgi:hypothetical protein